METTTDLADRLIGTTVITMGGLDPVTYAGRDPHGGGFESTTFRASGCTVHCDPERVAPASTPLADAKDPRITVTKGTIREARAAGHYGRGSWTLHLPGTRATWHNTKAEAVAAGRRRLAILDWHASLAA